MTCGDWTIAKGLTDGTPKYVLYRRDRIIGTFRSASLAQAACIQSDGSAVFGASVTEEANT